MSLTIAYIDPPPPIRPLVGRIGARVRMDGIHVAVAVVGRLCASGSY